MRILYMDFNLPYLIVDADYPVGGATVEWHNWILGFTKLGNKVGVLTFQGAEQYCNNYLLDFDILEVFSTKKIFLRSLAIFVKAIKVFYKVKKWKPDLIIQEVAGWETGFLSLISKLLRVHFIYRSANNIDVDFRIKKRIKTSSYYLFRLGLYLSDSIACQNEYQYSRFKAKFPKKNIFIVANPYYSKPYKIKSERRTYIAWIGIFQYQKNIPLLFNVIKANPDLFFKIAGSVNANDNKFKIEEIERFKGLKNVEMVGYLKRNQIYSFLNSAICLLNTSRFEGFSNTFLEAWDCGTPVFTLRHNDPSHIIEGHKLGYVFPSNEKLISEFRETIDQFNFSEANYRCREYVKEHHSPTTLAEKFLVNLKRNVRL